MGSYFCTPPLKENYKVTNVEDWHTLQYILIGNRMLLYIDGEKYLDHIDSEDAFSGGDLWIETQKNVEFLIDNIKVYEVIPGEGSIEDTVATADLCAPGETLLLYENFESGIQPGWHFQDAKGVETEPWSIVDDGEGNYVLQVDGHNWAQYPGFTMQDIEYRLRMRTASDGDGTHINFGSSEAGRYYLAVGDEVALYKDPGNVGIGYGDYPAQTQWHEIKIANVGGQIDVYVDDQLRIEYEDTDPLPEGIIAIENSFGLIWYDDIVVCGVSVEGDASALEDDSSSQDLGLLQVGEETMIVSQTYFDDFEDGIADFWNTTTRGWWRAEEVGETRALRGGGTIRIKENFVFQDFGFDVDINFFDTSPERGYYGATFVFRGGECSHYNLEIFAEGGGLNKVSCKEETINYGYEFPITPGEWHHLQVRMVGNHITVFINDEPVLDFSDDGEPIVQGWFSFEGHEAADITYYDNFSLKILESVAASDLFIDSGLRLGERNTRAIAAGDLDGDGDLDLIAGNSGQTNLCWKNAGDNLFIQSFETSSPDDTYGVNPGDFDGDGDLDLFLTNWEGSSHILTNDGQGGFEKGQLLMTDEGLSRGWGADIGDLDGDGDLDLWMAGDQNYVYINDGSGEFALSETSYHSADSVGVALGDLDNDGDLDAFVANYVGGANFVFLNRGNGIFTDSGQRLGDFPSNDVALGDLDGDGDLDAFVANLDDQPNTVWLNNGEGAFVDSGQRLDQLTSNSAALGDLDNDGDLDVYVVNGKIDQGQPKSNTIYFNDGSGSFDEVEHVASLTISTDVVLLDLNEDGWLDIVEATTETILVHFNQMENIQEGSAEETLVVPEGTAEEAVEFVQYSDDFEDGIADFWGEAIFENARLESFEGNQILRGPDWIGFWAVPHLTDFELEIDFYPAEPSAAEGIHGAWFDLRAGTCPLGSDASLMPAYHLEILDNGLGLIKLSCDGSIESLDFLAQGITPNEWHTFKASLVGNQIQILIDDFQVFDYVDKEDPHLSGTAILFSGIMEDITYFDNFLLSDLSSEGETSAFSPCDFTLDDVGSNGKVTGEIVFIDDTIPNVWFADLMGDGCNLGISVDSGQSPAHANWFNEVPEAFVEGASIIVEGIFVSFPYPDNPDQMQLILELTAQPQIFSSGE